MCQSRKSSARVYDSFNISVESNGNVFRMEAGRSAQNDSDSGSFI